MQTILYPITYPSLVLLRTLSPFFSQNTLLVPTEDLLTEIHALASATGAALRAYCPAPLNDGLSDMLQRFRQWTGWASSLGIGERLSGQSFVSMSSGQDETMQAIMERIKGDAENDSLLMARFFLWIAHQTDRTEDDVRMSLDSLPSEDALLREPLEDATDFAAKTPIARLESLSQVRKRLVNWAEFAKIYLAGPDANNLLPVGQDIGVKDMLDSAYEAMFTGRTAQELVSLRLSFNDLQRLKDSSEFQHAWQTFSHGLKQFVSAPNDAGDAFRPLEIAAENIHGMAEQILTREPKTITLTCTLYVGVSWQALLFHACGERRQAQPLFDRNACGVSFFVF
jgi:hypothetical protein